MDLNSLVPVIVVLLAWTGLVEWRIRSMYTQLREKIEDKELLNRTIQDELKRDIARLEAKMDMMIDLQLRIARNEKSRH